MSLVRPSMRSCHATSRRAQAALYPTVLAQVEVCSADEALALLRRGSRQRQRGETALNYSSSRSHSIFTVRWAFCGMETSALRCLVIRLKRPHA